GLESLLLGPFRQSIEVGFFGELRHPDLVAAVLVLCPRRLELAEQLAELIGRGAREDDRGRLVALVLLADVARLLAALLTRGDEEAVRTWPLAYRDAGDARVFGAEGEGEREGKR